MTRPVLGEASARRAWGALLLCIALGASSLTYAHLAVSTRSLRWLIAESDLVVRGRPIVIKTAVVPDGSDEIRRPVVRVELLEVLKGPKSPGKKLEFAQHGHGVAQYVPGEEALFFLRPTSKSRELRKLAVADGIQWHSTQEHDDAYVLSSDSRGATLKAARRYVVIEELPPPERTQALRRITVQLLASRDLRLATSALRDLTRAAQAPLITEDDVPRLMRIIHDGQTPIGVRVGLLAELQRRDLLASDPQWVRLLRSTNGSDRLTVIHAAGAHPSAAVNIELAKLVTGPDAAAASAAAVALGSPGNADAVDLLSNALSSGNTQLAMSAIRALGAIGTSEARAALEAAATTHENPRVRRRAEAELRVLEARSNADKR